MKYCFWEIWYIPNADLCFYDIFLLPNVNLILFTWPLTNFSSSSLLHRQPMCVWWPDSKTWLEHSYVDNLVPYHRLWPSLLINVSFILWQLLLKTGDNSKRDITTCYMCHGNSLCINLFKCSHVMISNPGCTWITWSGEGFQGPAWLLRLGCSLSD